MKHLIFLSFLLGFTKLHSQLLLKIEKDSLITYRYAGGDEFNQKQLSTDWNNAPWPRVIMSQDLAFQPDKVSLENGLIKFEAEKNDSIYIMGDIEIDSSFLKRKKMTLNKNQFLAKYSAGLILSKKKYHYGLYELRFKVEEGRGVWPAFWFYGGNKNEEIDAFELKGERNNKIHVDTHCPNGCDRNYNGHKFVNKNWGGWMPVSGYLHNGFNIMLLEWKQDEITWYINGKPLAYFKGTLPNPMNLYLNTSVAKDGGAFKPGPDTTTKWPNDYFVDYLRVWHRDSITKSTGNPILIANDNTTLSDKYPDTYEIGPKKKSGLNYNKKKLNGLNGMIILSVSSKGKLIVNPLGINKKQKCSLSIIGATTKQSFTISDFSKETIINLDNKDKEIEITLSLKAKNYSKSIEIKY